MSALLASIMAMLPTIFLRILGTFVTEAFLQSVIEKVALYVLRKAADMSTNTLDNEIVDSIEALIKSKGQR